MAYTINVVRGPDSGILTFQSGGVSVDTQCWWDKCWVPLDYVDTRSRRLLESRRFLHDLTLALRRA